MAGPVIQRWASLHFIKRFIVAADVYYDFLAKLKERFAKLVPGDPMDPQTTLAPMNSKRAKESYKTKLTGPLPVVQPLLMATNQSTYLANSSNQPS